MSAPPQLAPPARIRVVTHPPLDPLRAWLPLPTHAPGGAPATVRRVLEQAQALLPGHPVLSAELQGFALLPDSPVTVLDPVNDILDLRLSTAAPVAARSAAQVALPPSSPSSASHRSSSSGPPVALSTKRLHPNGKASLHQHVDGVQPPLKRSRRTSARSASPSSDSRSSSASSSSSSSSSPSSFSSSSSSSSSSSDSESSDSSSEASSELPLPSPGPSRLPQTAQTVPPGQGKRRTQKRNVRKRTLRRARARERRPDAAASLGAEPKEGLVEAARFESSELPGQASGSPSMPYTEQTSVLPSTKAPPLRKDPYGGYDATPSKRNDLEWKQAATTGTVSSVNGSASDSSGQMQRRAILRSDSPYFIAPQPSDPTSALSRSSFRPTTSPAYQPKSPDVSYPEVPQQLDSARTPAALAAAPAAGPASAPLSAAAAAGTMSFVPPSKRTDLPPHMFVTKVNVEGKRWQPGVGHRVAGTSRDYVDPPTRDLVAPVVAGSGMTALPNEPAPPQNLAAPSADAPALPIPTTKPSGDPFEASSIDARWDSLPRLEASTAKRGDLVATKVLELDPTTFVPTVSLKYGRLLAPSQVHHLRIQLHPNCLAALDEAANSAWEQGAQDEYGDEETEWYGEWHEKPKFGQDLLEERQEEDPTVWEGDWEGADVRALVV